MHSLFLRGCVTDRTTAARISNSFDFLRLLVVYDRQVMAHYLQFLTFLLCVILLVLLLPLQDHQEMMIIKTDSKFFWIVAESMNDNTDGALVAGQRVSGPYPSSIRYYIPLNGLLTKYIADAASYTAIGSGALYIVLMGPMLLPMQITLSLWKEGLHILTIKISNKFFFQNSISFILGCFTKFRHYKKLQQATKRQMWRRGRFLELSRLLNQRGGPEAS